MDLLVVNSLTKTFAIRSSLLSILSNTLSSRIAINNISFSIKKGEIIGLAGANGAGKSTLMHMLIGILKPTNGSICYFDQDFASNRSALLQEVAFASSYCKLASALTIVQNLKFFARIYNMPEQESDKKIDDLLLYFELARYKHTKVADLSAGEGNKVSVLKAFLPNAKIVLLDEPTAFLDLKAAALVKAFIKQRREIKGTSFLLTTHNPQDIEELCDRVLILHQGKMTESSIEKYLEVQRYNQSNGQGL